MRLLVTGGRNYNDRAFVFATLDRAHAKHRIALLIHGACCDRTGRLRGADGLAEEWAIAREVAYVGEPARWGTEGRAAGPRRNARMLDRWTPEAVVAFPGGEGTADMVQRALAAGLPVWDLRASTPTPPAADKPPEPLPRPPG
jgi:YspA, cpYpsA-related SLOG family